MRYKICATLILILLSISSVHAKNYFIKNNGNDNAAGTSDATAWKTIKKVNKYRFATGDDIYFKAGDSWALEQLIIDWSGTQRNRSFVGAYYMRNNSTTLGLPKTGEKPVISGGYLLKTNYGSVPKGIYGGLVEIRGSYVTVQNLKVQNSSGDGITIARKNRGVKNTDNVIENNEIIKTVGALVRAHRGSDRTIIRNNVGSKCVWSDFDRIKPYVSHPACLVAVDGKDGLIEGNTVYDLYGEGIAVVQNATNWVIRNNMIANGKYVGIYTNGSSGTIIENNLIIGNGTQNARSVGIAISIEINSKRFNDINNIIRNNLIAGVTKCLHSGLFPEPRALGKFTGGKFIGNTCIAADTAVAFYQSAKFYGKWEVANNIFANIKGGNRSCFVPTNRKINFHHNLWDVKQKDKDCKGSGDIYGDPKLTSSQDFWSFSYRNQPSIADFKPRSTSPVLNKGAQMTDLLFDYEYQARPSIPNIGALEIITGIIIDPPGRLRLNVITQ